MYGVDKLYIPQTLEEALQILARDPEVMPLAGGTDILVKMRHKALKRGQADEHRKAGSAQRRPGTRRWRDRDRRFLDLHLPCK